MEKKGWGWRVKTLKNVCETGRGGGGGGGVDGLGSVLVVTALVIGV